MSGNGRAERPLTDEQRRLVRGNIGLVAVHLRRHVGRVPRPRRDREWEDLFQEGCLGLIQAALTYREERGIPFAAFALPRIHNSVSRALQCKFSTVRVPPPQNGRRGKNERTPQPRDRPAVVKTHSLSDELGRCLRDKRRQGPREPDGETIGHRLRDKYDRAVRVVANKASRTTSTRGDRGELVRVLVDERLLVPHEDSRRALRQIARDTKSSYARVAECERQLREAVRSMLQGDPEFAELTRRARANHDGTSAAIDGELEDELAVISADEFVRRFREAPTVERARMLDAFLSLPGNDIDDVLRGRVVRLSPTRRERLLRSEDDAS
jgi:hypothetical protein